MRLHLLFVISFCILIAFPSCSQKQLLKSLSTLKESSSKDKLSTNDVTGGLKDALIKGITVASKNASAKDGYYKNSLIKIPFPEEIIKVKKTLKDIGMSSLVNDFELSLNRAAEKSAQKATPIFVNAITSMSVKDAWGILKGDDEHAATSYLKKTTNDSLTTTFNPIVKESLNETDATKYFSKMVTQYNKVPFVSKVNPNLDEYATEKAIDGLFLLVEKEEEKIRDDPSSRTTELMQKVFDKSNW